MLKKNRPRAAHLPGGTLNFPAAKQGPREIRFLCDRRGDRERRQIPDTDGVIESLFYLGVHLTILRVDLRV